MLPTWEGSIYNICEENVTTHVISFSTLSVACVSVLHSESFSSSLQMAWASVLVGHVGHGGAKRSRDISEATE